MLEKEINDILTNGNADTAAERLGKLFMKHSERSREIELRLESKLNTYVDDNLSVLTPSELVEAAITPRGYDSIVVLSFFVGALAGAVLMYIFGGVL